VVLVEHAVAFQQRHHAGLVRSSQLQTQLVQARMQALKMQLHPHFLFNTLHTITALVHEDPDLAEQTLARLGELLRLFLATGSMQEAPLKEELRILDLYLEIERARFEDRLQVRYDVPASLFCATVPNLILQPLVENSIRHGIGKKAEPGRIVISAEQDRDQLVLCVTDNGAGMKNEAEGTRDGMGLSITRGRLAALYGRDQSLVLRNLQPCGVEARITLPLRTEVGAYQLKEPLAAQTHVEL
jgi:LytS/YehU family sensor histidine kinase